MYKTLQITGETNNFKTAPGCLPSTVFFRCSGADTGAPLKWKDIPSPLQFEAGAKEVPDVLDQAVVGI